MKAQKNETQSNPVTLVYHEVTDPEEIKQIMHSPYGQQDPMDIVENLNHTITSETSDPSAPSETSAPSAPSAPIDLYEVESGHVVKVDEAGVEVVGYAEDTESNNTKDSLMVTPPNEIADPNSAYMNPDDFSDEYYQKDEKSQFETSEKAFDSTLHSSNTKEDRKRFNSEEFNKYRTTNYLDSLKMLYNNVIGLFSGETPTLDLIKGFTPASIKTIFATKKDINVSEVTEAGVRFISIYSVYFLIVNIINFFISNTSNFKDFRSYHIVNVLGSLVETALFSVAGIAVMALGIMLLCKFRHCWDSVVSKIILIFSLIAAIFSIVSLGSIILGLIIRVTAAGIIQAVMQIVGVVFIMSSINVLSKFKELERA